MRFGFLCLIDSNSPKTRRVAPDCRCTVAHSVYAKEMLIQFALRDNFNLQGTINGRALRLQPTYSIVTMAVIIGLSYCYGGL